MRTLADQKTLEPEHELQPSPVDPPTKPPTTVTVGTIDPDDEFWDIIEANWERNQFGMRIFAVRPESAMEVRLRHSGSTE